MKRILVVVGVVGAIVIAGCIIVIPLWYFATHAKQAFTITVLLLFGGGVITFAVVKIKRKIEYHRYYQHTSLAKTALVAFFRALGKIAGFAGALYVLVLLYSRNVLLVAIPLTVILILLFGYILYGRRETRTDSTA
jgi:hypothetical protein